MTELHQKLMLLRPMRTGVSGFARLQWDRGQAWAQLNVRGIKNEGIRAFWYSGGGDVRELGTCAANARGEASLEGPVPGDRYAPERLQALIVVENTAAPRPLLIGLCTETSAGSLLDAKNASLSLCEKLARAAAPKREPVEPKPLAPSAKREAPKEGQEKAAPNRPPYPQQRPASVLAAGREKALPREIFLPALDPAPYVQAMEPPEEENTVPPFVRQGSAAPVSPAPAPQTGQTQKPPRTGLPVGRLPSLEWPKAFGSLREYFEHRLPDAPFDWPGWRFVQASRQGDGLWIGRQVQDGQIRRVAYAMRGAPPRDDPRPYQPVRGRNGELYRVLVQRA